MVASVLCTRLCSFQLLSLSLSALIYRLVGSNASHSNESTVFNGKQTMKANIFSDLHARCRNLINISVQVPPYPYLIEEECSLNDCIVVSAFYWFFYTILGCANILRRSITKPDRITNLNLFFFPLRLPISGKWSISAVTTMFV